MAAELFDNIISAADADRLIAAHDGDVALLYIFKKRTGGSLESAATALCRTLREMEEAEEKLGRMGLCQGGVSPSKAAFPISAAPAPAEDELPEYSAKDISRRCSEDAAFAAVLEEARRVMGRNLSSVDMKTLFAVYDYLGLPVDVMLLMINYCGRLCEEKYQGRRRPTAKFIRNEADNWARNEIVTMEQAEEYMRRQDQRRSLVSRAKDALGIRGRELSPTEREYINQWLDMGFDEACLAIAYDRTVTNTGSLKWSYMNKILLSWKEKGLLSEKAILEKDGRKRPVPMGAGKGKPLDFSGLDSMIDKI